MQNLIFLELIGSHMMLGYMLEAPGKNKPAFQELSLGRGGGAYCEELWGNGAAVGVGHRGFKRIENKDPQLLS